jgi:FtsP/CotA-like multicopper oxidase with cupredoxin domain
VQTRGVFSRCSVPSGETAGTAQSHPRPEKSPRGATSDFSPDLELRVTATQTRVPILPGNPTRVWRYHAELLHGDPTSIQTWPNSYLGPIIRAHTGQKIRVWFVNDLPDQTQASIIHWHGLHLPPDMDAHPRYAIRPGQTYVYEWTITDRAGTYWFHPHPHIGTGYQVYQGLAGLLLVSDADEEVLGLPAGTADIPLVIQDRTFDALNQLLYLSHDKTDAAMQQVMGFLGERVLVNGQPDYTLDVATRPYRLRLLNASNARIYKLAWSDGTPLRVIATDGGLLEHPLQRSYVMLAPGERVELWADFSGRAIGSAITLQSVAFEGAEGADDGHDMVSMHQMSAQPSTSMSTDHPTIGMHDMHAQPSVSASHDHTMATMGTMDDMDHGSAAAAPPLGAPLTILTLRVITEVQDTTTLPDRLATFTRYRIEDAINRERPRTFTFTQPDMRWLINGRAFDIDSVTPDETVTRDTLEVWELINALNEGETMHPQGMAHPFHIHGVQFQVIDREVLPELADGWNSVRDGYIDEGWKDTVLLMPGERVTLLVKLPAYTGTYMIHCHNLEHEDAGMMRNYEVVA